MENWTFLIILYLGMAPAQGTLTCTEAIRIFRFQKLACAPDSLLRERDGQIEFLVLDAEDAMFPLKVVRFVGVDHSESGSFKRDINFGIQVLMELKDNPLVVRHFDAWETKKGFFILVEHLAGGTLEEFLEKRPQSMQNPYFVLRLLNGIARAVKEVWDRGFEVGSIGPSMVGFDADLKVRLYFLGGSCRLAQESRRKAQMLMEEALDETRANSELSEQNSQAAELSQWYSLPSLRGIVDPLLTSKNEIGYRERMDRNSGHTFVEEYSFRSLWIPAGTELTVARAIQLATPEARPKPWLQDDLLLITDEALKLPDTQHYLLVEETIYEPLRPLERADFTLIKNPKTRSVGYWKGRFDQVVEEVQKTDQELRRSLPSPSETKPGLMSALLSSFTGCCKRNRNGPLTNRKPRLLEKVNPSEPDTNYQKRLQIR